MANLILKTTQSDWINIQGMCVNIFEIREGDAWRYKNKVRVFPGRGCYSGVGMSWKPWTTDLSLAHGCVNHNGVIQHEFLHALGKLYEINSCGCIR